jgi:hypothetical protein
MTNPIEPVRPPVPRRLLPVAATQPARALTRGLAAIAAWARLTNSSLRLGAVDVVLPLDPQSRALLWHILTETISTIGELASADAPPEVGLTALRALADRVRERVALGPPRAAFPPDRAEPPQIFVLEILTHDLQPCLGRWLPRLDAWRDTGQRAADWPLAALCRADLGRSRERLVERAWQLGMALNLPGLDRLLPERPAAAPALIAGDEITGAEAAGSAPPDPASLDAGWRIYVEAATRIPARDMPSGPGALGEVIASLGALADEIREGLKAMPPPRSNDAAGTIQALTFELLTGGVQPFLSEWRLRYRRFAASERPESKWGRAEECRAALAATRARCLPKIQALGRKIGAPPPFESTNAAAAAEEAAPLQLPPPEMRS